MGWLSAHGANVTCVSHRVMITVVLSGYLLTLKYGSRLGMTSGSSCGFPLLWSATAGSTTFGAAVRSVKLGQSKHLSGSAVLMCRL